MDVKMLVEATWEQSRRHILPLLILSLILLAVSILSFGILAPVASAGYYDAILKMVRYDREPVPADIFSKMHLFLPLLVFGLACVAVISLGFLLMVIPGVIITLAICFCCMYMMPLMVDKQLGVIDAIKESYAMVRRGSMTDHIITLVIFIGVQALGSSVLLGALVTTPLSTVFLMNVYNHIQGHDNL